MKQLFKITSLLFFLLVGITTYSQKTFEEALDITDLIIGGKYSTGEINTNDGANSADLSLSGCFPACCSLYVYYVKPSIDMHLRVSNDNYQPLTSSIIAYESEEKATDFTDLRHISAFQEAAGNFCGFRDTLQIGQTDKFALYKDKHIVNNGSDPLRKDKHYYFLVWNYNSQTNQGTASSNFTFEFVPDCPDGFTCEQESITRCTEETFTTPGGYEMTESEAYSETVGTVITTYNLTIDTNADCCPEGFTCTVEEKTISDANFWISPLGNTIYEDGVVIDVDGTTRTSYNVTFNRANVTPNVFPDVNVVENGSVTYTAKTNATGYLQFTKTDKNYVNLNVLAEDLNGTDRSVFMWVKSEADVVGDNQVLFAANTSTGGNVSLFLIDNDGENLEIYDGSDDQSASYDMGDDAWHYVGYTYNETTTETIVYVDGVENDRFKDSQTTADVTQYSLGQEFDNSKASDFFNGKMAEISIWNTVLTPAEMKLSMRAKIETNHPNYSNLVGYYSIFGTEADDIGILKDHSGNGNDGTFVNDLTIDFTKAEAIVGFNAVAWYDEIQWTKDNSVVGTGNTYITATGNNTFELKLSRDYVVSKDTWATTAQASNQTSENFTDITYCDTDLVPYTLATTKVSYLDFEQDNEDYITVDAVADDIAGKDRSVFMWVKKETDVSGEASTLFSINQKNKIITTTNLQIATSEKLAIYNGSTTYTATTILVEDVWYYIGYTYDATSFETKVYVNGVEDDSFTSEMPATVDDFISIGQEYDLNTTSNFFDGKLTEISVWNKLLSETEIKVLMAASANITDENLVGYYGVHSSIANYSVKDNSTKGNNGIATSQTIIVTDILEEISDFDNSGNYTISWTKGGAEFDTDANTEITPEEGTKSYGLSYSIPYFNFTENWDLSYTNLLTSQPIDATAGVTGNAMFEVDVIDGATYQWYNNEQSLKTITYNIGNAYTYNVYADGDIIYAATQSGLLISKDGGVTWEVTTSIDYGFSSANDRITYVDIEGDTICLGTFNDGISTSTDGGTTWTTTLNGENGYPASTSQIDAVNVYDLQVVNGIIYIATEYGFVISTDGGANWVITTSEDNGFSSNDVGAFYLEGNSIHIITTKGIFTSIDFGVTWTTMTDSYPSYQYGTESLYVKGEVVYIASRYGLIKSTDGGATWNKFESEENGFARYTENITSLHVEGDTIYAGFSYDETSGGSGSRIFVSKNGGASWSVIISNENDFVDTNINDIYVEGGNVYFATSSGLQISSSGKVLIDSTEDTVDNAIQGATTNSLTLNNLSLDQNETEYFVEVTKDNCTQESDSVELTVADAPIVDSTLPSSGATDIAIDNAIDIVFNSDIELGNQEIYIKATETDFTATSTVSIVNGNTVRIQPSTALEYGTKYYITLNAGAVLKTDNNGESLAITDTSLYTFTTVCDTLISTQPTVKTAGAGGSTTFTVPVVSGASYQWYADESAWITTTAGENGYANSTIVRSVYADGNTIYVGTGLGLSVSIDGGASWTTTISGENGFATNDFITSVYAEGDTIYVGTFGGGLSISTDEGANWTVITSGENGFASNNFINSVYADGNTIYVGTGEGLSISIDGGESWITTTLKQNGFSFSDNVQSVYADGDSIYAGTLSGGLSISKDGGASWITTTSGKNDFAASNRINSVYADGDSIYAGTSFGLSISIDGGANWTTTIGGENGFASDNFINSVYADGDTIYAGTNTGGLSLSRDGGASWTTTTFGENGFPASNDVRSVYINGDTIYAGTNTGGFAIYSSGKILSDETDTTATNQIQGATTNSLTINNLSLDQNETEYFVKVTKGICSELSSTVALSVLEAPNVIALNPVNKGEVLDLESDLEITFSEEIIAGTGNIIIKNTEDDSIVETIAIPSEAITINGAKLSINPTQNFEAGTAYYVELEAGAVQGVVTGQSNLEITGNTTWNFRAESPFIITVKTTTVNEGFTLPVNPNPADNYIYDYSIDWGDGEIEVNQTTSAIHTYAEAGNYDIKIWNTFPAINFTTAITSAAKVTDIKQWGGNAWLSMVSAFLFTNLTELSAIDIPDLSNVTDMSGMFNNASLFNSDISDWDVSNVKNMTSMFKSAKAFNQPLDSWNVSNVTNMSSMFSNTAVFNQPLNNWDVSNVTHMTNMFFSAAAFNQSLNDWDVSSVTNMSSMFGFTTVFDEPLNDWDVSNVTDMSGMFNSLSSAFNQDLSDWNFSGLTKDATNFIKNTSLSSNNYEALLISLAAQNLFNQDSFLVGSIDVSDVTYCEAASAKAILITRGWEFTDGGEDCGTSQGNIVVSSTSPKNNATEITTDSNLEITFNEEIKVGTGNLFIKSTEDDSILETIAITSEAITIDGAKLTINPTQNLDAGTTYYVVLEAGVVTGLVSGNNNSEVTDKTEWTFTTEITVPENTFILTVTTTSENESFTIPINSNYTYDYAIDWGDGVIVQNQTTSATHTYVKIGNYDIKIWNIFPAIKFNGDSENAAKLTDIKAWGAIEWQSMAGAFSSTSLTKLSATDTPDLSSVIYMSGMFQRAKTFNHNIDNWDVSSVENMNAMFSDTEAFNQDLNSWNVANVTNFSYMFEGAKAFNGDISTWDVSNAITFERMFAETVAFNSSLANWDVSNGDRFHYMFYRTESFNQDMPNWNLESASSTQSMFRESKVFNGDISNWNMTNVDTAFSMFEEALMFNGDISSWDLSGASDLDSMFEEAPVFNQDISAWNVSNVNDLGGLFEEAVAFNQDISNWNVAKNEDFSKMFKGASSFDQDLSSWDFTGTTNDIEEFIVETNLSSCNYDKLLISLDAQSLSNGEASIVGSIDVSNTGATYCNADSVIADLIERGWVFVDGGKNCEENCIAELNTAPEVTEVQVSGITTIDESLTGTYSFMDLEEDAEKGSVYSWLRADNSNGANKVAISGATESTYVLTADDAGKHIAFTVTPSDGAISGALVTSSYTAVVAKKTPSLSFENITKTYGDADFNLAAITNSTGTLSYKFNEHSTLSTLSAGTVSLGRVGEVFITVNLLEDATYKAASANALLTITKATLTATGDNHSRAYGTENPNFFTITYDGFKNGDTLISLGDGAPFATTTVNRLSAAGVYVIAVPSSETQNYKIVGVDGVLTIDKKLATITADSKTKIYGDSDSKLTYEIEGLETEDTFTGSLSRVLGENVGNYAISSTLSNDNYEITFIPSDVTITKAILTASVRSESRVYGAENPDFTITYDGFKNGDELISLGDGAPFATTIANRLSAAGVYAITVPSSETQNYKIVGVDGVLTIDKKLATITADSKTKIYGDSDSELTYEIEGLETEDTFTGSLSRESGENVGVYAITSTLSNDNYEITFTPSDLTITKAILTATGDNHSRTYRSENPNFFTITYDGFKNGDTLISLGDGAPFATTTANELSAAGIYAITVPSSETQNYKIIGVDGVLTIDKKSATITADSKTKVYGDSDSELTYEIEGLETEDTFTGSLSRVLGENVGVYAISSTLSNDNYEITFIPSDVTITKATLTASVRSESRVYGEENPDFTITYDGFKNEDELISLGDGAPFAMTTANRLSAAGVYAITVPSSETQNYKITGVDGVLTIDKKSATITADTKRKIYGDSDPELTYEIDGLETEDTFTGSLSRESGENVGVYAITSTLSNDNYEITFVPSDLTIEKAKLTATGDNHSRAYRSENPNFFTITYDGFKNGDTLISLGDGAPFATTTANELSTAGIYAITVPSSETQNYKIIGVDGVLTVDKRSLTINADSKTKVYGELDPEFTYEATLLGTDVLTGSLSRVLGENVGVYAITSTLSNANYDIVFVPANVTITKKELIITADSKSKVYGEIDPVFTYKTTLLGADVLTGSLFRDSGEDVDIYEITSTLANENYAITFKTAELEITPLEIIVIANDIKVSFEDAEDFEFSYTDYTAMTLINGDLLEGSLSREVGFSTDHYEITQGNLHHDNYNIVYTSGTFTIEEKLKEYGFSPNGDGTNDTWRIREVVNTPNNKVEVFNRSGKLVYTQEGYDNDNNAWDGISNRISTSKKLPVGIYHYAISLNGGKKVITGWLYINY